jgi:hypothetical protein
LQRQSYLAPEFIVYFIALTAYVLMLWYWIAFSKSPMLKKFAWGNCGGAITGMQNFLKDTLTIVKAAENERHYPWFFYLFIILAAASAFVGLLILTACMKRYDATYSSATFVGSFVISASIMSAVHYQTFRALQGVWNYVLYPFGLIVLMVGVILLVREKRVDVVDDQFPEGEDRDSEDSEVGPKSSVRKVSLSFHVPVLTLQRLVAILLHSS